MHAIGVRVPEKQPATAGGRRRRSWSALIVLGCAGLLFFCYLRIAGTVRVNSDAAGLVLDVPRGDVRRDDVLRADVLGGVSRPDRDRRSACRCAFGKFDL